VSDRSGGESARAWTGSPVRPHPQARHNGSAELPWGGRRARLPLNWPFTSAVQGYRTKALANPQYDPASTFVWGQMMAVGLLSMLSAIEERFGGEGHDLVRGALREVGDRIATEMLRDVEIPADLSAAELASLYASWINEVVYASVEAPTVEGETAAFDIHYCPHEDVYGAFDCRVQRYLVEGMIDAARRHFPPDRAFDVAFATTIPSGSATCHFDLVGRTEGEDRWNRYSHRLRDRALRIAAKARSAAER
jgi:hypothetical protein